MPLVQSTEERVRSVATVLSKSGVLNNQQPINLCIAYTYCMSRAVSIHIDFLGKKEELQYNSVLTRKGGVVAANNFSAHQR